MYIHLYNVLVRDLGACPSAKKRFGQVGQKFANVCAEFTGIALLGPNVGQRC